jgi:hypothetical protein
MSQNAKDIHRTLQVVFEELLCVSNFDGLSLDTIFALGEALGIITKAKALVGRDIDQAEGAHAKAGAVSGQDGAGSSDRR